MPEHTQGLILLWLTLRVSAGGKCGWDHLLPLLKQVFGKLKEMMGVDSRLHLALSENTEEL